MFNILGIDWGSKRVGLAFGDESTGLVIPADYPCLSGFCDDLIAKEIFKRDIKKIVIGLPTNFNKQKTEVTEKVLDFVSGLKKTYPKIEVITVDESGSSKDAKSSIGIDPSVSKDLINHLAAQKILQYYFDFYK